MTYACVLLSDQDGRFYVGGTGDLRARLQKHNSGAVRFTAYRRPFWNGTSCGRAGRV